MSNSEIISKVYYDESGYGSKKAALDDARQKDKSIMMADINEVLQKSVKHRKHLRG